MYYDVDYVRSQFPAMQLKVNGYPAAFFDGPGGTQVPQRVIDAMVDYLVRCNANAGGCFLTSHNSDLVISNARQSLADFLGAGAEEIAFGHNTTTMLYQLAFALGRKAGERDEIIITEIDHEANRGPWLSLQERGFKIREVKIDAATCTVNMDDYQEALSEKTLVAAFNYASNGVGTVSDVKEMARLARAVGAISVVDAVHYALHGSIAVKALDIDYLVCSAYKFFGPHLGVIYGKKEHFASLPAYRLRVQDDAIPYRIETGTLNHEGIAGAGEAINFIADLGSRFGDNEIDSINPLVIECTERRRQIVAGMKAMENYEQPLAEKLIAGLSALEKVTVYGPPKGHPRTSTVSFTLQDKAAGRVAAVLGEKGIFVWDGHFYAARLVERLGLQEHGGLIRVGLSPYNTEAEIERLLDEVKKLAL